MLKHHFSEKKYPSRVVLLGSSGFVGGALSDYLASEKVPVLAIGSKDIDLTDPKSVDALKGKIKEGDSVVMLSTLTPDKGKDVATLLKNVTMAKHLSDFVQAVPLGHLVYISSDAVYADDLNPVQESVSAAPGSLYGTMHLAREQALKEAAQKNKTPFVILRSSVVYGAKDTHNSYGPNRFLRNAMKTGKIPLFGGGEETRDHVAVGDVARIIGLCLAHRSEGLLNVASGQSRSFYDVAKTVAKAVGAHVEVETSPRASAITHRHFDITSLVQAFPTFRFQNFEDGVKEAFSQTTKNL